MQDAAEILRWALITLQALLVLHMIRSGLWHRLPLFVTWLATDAASRMLFHPSGNYWHLIWLPLQPSLLFLVGAAALEARYQAGLRTDGLAYVSLAISPLSLSLSLPDLITMRWMLHGMLAVVLATASGTFTAIWHARIMATVCAITALSGWIPSTGTQWWMMRVGFLATYCGCCLAWLWLMNRTNAADPETTAESSSR